MKISTSDYALYNRMEAAAQEAVEQVLAARTEGCTCQMCREDMQCLLLNQLKPQYVPLLPGISKEPWTLEDLGAKARAEVMAAAEHAVFVVRHNPRHGHERAPMQNCTEAMVLGALGEVLTREKLALGREELSRLMAEVLNELPPRYTTSFKGDAFARTAELEAASVASILTAIYGALKRLEMIPGSA
ncbi:MAG TPA: late competence development ComFB family protein [Limnochordia bacterium]|nr:late competence development ComFB family protein [Bacillota bacterium]HOK30529.1 late competence development ComFB family protein [Limnochordia bacterium]